MNWEIEDPRWTAYLLDELSEEEAAKAERCLSQDPALRAEIEALRRTLGNLQTALSDNPPPAFDPLRREAVLRTRPSEQPSNRKSGSRFWWPTAAAALLAVGFGLSNLLMKSATPPEEELQADEISVSEIMLDEDGPDGGLDGGLNGPLGTALEAAEAPPAPLREEKAKAFEAFGGAVESSAPASAPDIALPPSATMPSGDSLRRTNGVMPAGELRQRAEAPSNGEGGGEGGGGQAAGRLMLRGVTGTMMESGEAEEEIMPEPQPMPTPTPIPTPTPTPTPEPIEKTEPETGLD